MVTPSGFDASAESLPEYCSEDSGQVICTIDILPFAEPQAYAPKVAEIPVGAQVVFVNTGPEIHTATGTDATKDDASPSPNGTFDTGILAPDEKSEPITMDTAGEFRYYCAVHPDMRATLVVGSGDISSSHESSMKETSSTKSLGFSSHDAQGNSLSGGELPIMKISSVGDEAFMIDGTTPKGGSDAFSYDGSGHEKISGNVEVDLDPISNTGTITAEWTDPEGNDWRLEQTKFGGGNELYPGELVDGTLQYELDADPIAINHYEHGTTGAGPPVEPTLFVYLASWGPAEVWKNGESQGTFETHMMVTEGARNPETGKIVKSDGDTPYSPKTPGDSMVNDHAAQLHLVYHTPAGDPTNNFPPPFEVFEHLMFYNLDPPLPVTHVIGSNTYMVDGTTPKGGSDAFSYDGSGHEKLPNGQVEVNLDPKSNSGSILAEWTDPEGNDWRLEQTKFGGGNELYPGELVDGELQYELDADPIAINHYEHGTTGAGPPVEPTLFVYLASWGPAEVWKNGESQGTFETHMMITDAARNPETGKIVKSDGTTPYSPMTPGDSKTNKHAAQLHLVYHTPAGDPTNNFPPPFEVFEHLMFYDIDVLPPKVHKTMVGDKEIADLPPLKQVKHDIAPADVTCASGMELVMKKSDGSPACVFPDSIDKLVSIGWADFF